VTRLIDPPARRLKWGMCVRILDASKEQISVSTEDESVWSFKHSRHANVEQVVVC